MDFDCKICGREFNGKRVLLKNNAAKNWCEKNKFEFWYIQDQSERFFSKKIRSVLKLLVEARNAPKM